jgi:hypothetical protein
LQFSARVIIKGADENEYFIGGVILESNGNYLCSLSRLVSSGITSWHWGYSQPAATNYFVMAALFYLSSSSNYIFGVATWPTNSYDMLFLRVILSSTSTNIPSSYTSYVFHSTTD